MWGSTKIIHTFELPEMVFSDNGHIYIFRCHITSLGSYTCQPICSAIKSGLDVQHLKTEESETLVFWIFTFYQRGNEFPAWFNFNIRSFSILSDRNNDFIWLRLSINIYIFLINGSNWSLLECRVLSKCIQVTHIITHIGL